MKNDLFINGRKIDSNIDIKKIDKSIFQLSLEFELSKEEIVNSLFLSFNNVSDLIDSILTLDDLRADLKSSNLNLKDEKNYFKVNSVLTGGFQSWSKAYEYNIKDNQTNIRLKPSLLRFIKSDYEDWFVKKNRFISNFYITIYENLPSTKNFTLISKDTVFPTTFVLYKKNKKLEIHLGLKGEKINGKFFYDKIYLIFCNDLNSQKEAFEKLFKNEFENSLKKINQYNLLDKSSKHIYGWESWYNYYTSITEKDCIKNLNLFGNFIKNFDVEARPIFQIDDGWEIRVGQWQQNEKFPTPLDKMAKMIEETLSYPEKSSKNEKGLESEKGFLPGIWMAPLALLNGSDIYKDHYEWVLKDKKGKPISCGNIPLWGGDFYTYDLSIKEAREYIINEVKKLVTGFGFKFLKLDFLYAGLVNGDHKDKSHGTAYYYNLFQNELISALGDSVILLGCGAPLQLSYPYYPIMRIGADTREEWELLIGKIAGYEGRPSAFVSLTDTLNRWILDKTAYFSDPDVGFFRKNKIKLTNKEKLLVNLIDFLFASQFMISDDCDDIDENVLQQVKVWISFFKDKKFFVRRFIEKDIYLAGSFDGKYYILINLKDKDFKISEKMLKLIPIIKTDEKSDIIRNIDINKNVRKFFDRFSQLIIEDNEIVKKKIENPFCLEKHGFIVLVKE